MHSNCILDSVANLLIHHVVFVQKSSIASHLKSFDPSLSFCCQGPALTGIKEGNERLHQLNLRNKQDVFVPQYDLQSRKSCCCLGYPGKNLGF